MQIKIKYWLIIPFVEQIIRHISNTCPEYNEKNKSIYTSKIKFTYMEK